MVRLPQWGVEKDGCGQPLLWLGQGEAEGIGGTLWSTKRQPVETSFEVEPGSARPDGQRTVEGTLENEARVQKALRQFDQATQLSFIAEFQPGRNDFQFSMLDEPTIL